MSEDIQRAAIDCATRVSRNFRFDRRPVGVAPPLAPRIAGVGGWDTCVHVRNPCEADGRSFPHRPGRITFYCVNLMHFLANVHDFPHEGPLRVGQGRGSPGRGTRIISSRGGSFSPDPYLTLPQTSYLSDCRCALVPWRRDRRDLKGPFFGKEPWATPRSNSPTSGGSLCAFGELSRRLYASVCGKAAGVLIFPPPSITPAPRGPHVDAPSCSTRGPRPLGLALGTTFFAGASPDSGFSSCRRRKRRGGTRWRGVPQPGLTTSLLLEACPRRVRCPAPRPSPRSPAGPPATRGSPGDVPVQSLSPLRASSEHGRPPADPSPQAMENFNIEKDIAAYIKKEFDTKFNPTWHCIVGRNVSRSFPRSPPRPPLPPPPPPTRSSGRM